MKSSKLPKLQNSGKSSRHSKADKDIGISRRVSPLRDQYVERQSNPKPKFPPGESANHHVETSGNRYGK